MSIVVEQVTGTTTILIGTFSGPSNFAAAITALRAAMAAAASANPWYGANDWFVRVRQPFLFATPTTLRGLADQTVYIVGEGVPGGRTTVAVGAGPLPSLHVGLEANTPPTFRVCLVRLDIEVSPAAHPHTAAIRVERGVLLTLDSCSLRANGPLHTLTAGVRFDPVPSGTTDGALRLNNCSVSRFLVGVQASRQRIVRIYDSAFDDCQVHAVLEDVTEVLVQNSQFEGGRIGLDLSGSEPDTVFNVEDCRFRDVETGVLVRYRRLRGELGAVRRSEFATPSAWAYDEQVLTWSLVGVPGRGVVLQIDVPLAHDSFDTDNPVALYELGWGLVVESCVFHFLDVGVYVYASARARILLDHNTYVLCRTAGVKLREGPLRWEPTLAHDPRLGGRYVIPSLIVSNSLFLGGRPDSDGAFGGVELGAWPLGFFPADPLAVPDRNWLLIAGNMFSGFEPPPGSSFVINRVFERAAGGSIVNRYTDGGHHHSGTPFANHLHAFPALARSPRLVSGELDWDYHPIRSLQSEAVDAAFDFMVPALDGSGPMDLLLELWGYPALPRKGFYGNESIVKGEVQSFLDALYGNPPPCWPAGAAPPPSSVWPIICKDGVPEPPRQTIGAAEPAGWAEFPLMLYGLLPRSFVDYEPMIDIFLPELGLDPLGLLGPVGEYSPSAPYSAPTIDNVETSLTGDPASDIWQIFGGHYVTQMAHVAVAVGLKISLPVISSGTRGWEEGDPPVLAPPGTTGWSTFPPLVNSVYGGTDAEREAYNAWWLGAVQLFVSRASADPVVRGATAYYYGTEEWDPDLPHFLRGYGLSLRFRELLSQDGLMQRPYLTYQDNHESLAGTFVSALVGWVDAPSLAPDVGDLSIDFSDHPNFWHERFGDGRYEDSPGVPLPGVALSVKRDQSPLTQITAAPAAVYAGYSSLSYSPVLDPLSFIAPAFDALMVGLGYEVGQRQWGVAAGLDSSSTFSVPPPSENRLFLRQRTESMREARSDAEYLASERSQTVRGTPVIPVLPLGPVAMTVPVGLTGDPADPYVWSSTWPAHVPPTAVAAAHDMLLALQSADGLSVWSINYLRLSATADMYDVEGNFLGNGVVHPGWAGYAAILRILKTELREFLVVGDRDFDLGFEIVDPSNPADQEVRGSDWGPMFGWMATWKRTNHLILRARNRVYLIVTRSQNDPPLLERTTFDFVHSSFGAGTTVDVLWPPNHQWQGSGPSAGYRFHDEIEGIDARVYRIDLA